MAEYYKCPKCDGSGIVNELNKVGLICLKCSGTGKVNWIENIFEIEPDYDRIQNKVIEQMTTKIAKQLDEEIVRMLYNDVYL
jgi:DnaJ-class molecular chaperone